jgi:hypothetical protein
MEWIEWCSIPDEPNGVDAAVGTQLFRMMHANDGGVCEYNM